MPSKLLQSDSGDSSPSTPSTPPRSSQLKNPLRRSASFAFKESLKLKFMSRGSQPNLVAYADSEAVHESSSKDEMRKKAGGNLMRNGKAWLRQRPHVVAIIALALLGSAGLVSTFGGPLRRSALGKHKRLMAQGIPESLMRVNITATYADNFCKSSAPSNLTTQHWTDGPICQRGNSTLKGAMQQTDACGAVINVPKIAMLFLGTKGFPHAAMWAMWFQQVRGLVPKDCVAKAFCPGRGTKGDVAGFNELVQACGPTDETQGLSSIVEQQHLFSLYVHLPPNKTLEGPPTIFTGHEIPNSIQTGWGDWSLAEASRVLIRESLKNPLNQRFIMLSESCVPIYPPAVVYQQLMWEKKSRINACDSDPNYYRDNYRYTWRMAPELDEGHWRKSFQWFGVVRKHAKVIAEDVKIARVFREHCVNAWDDDRNAWRSCFSDEHYFATVLATQGLDEETDCTGGMTHTEWCNPCLTADDRLHPTTFTADMVSQESMARMREDLLKGCNVSAAEALAGVSFVSSAQLAAGQECGQPPPLSMEGGALGRGCPLFARKFPSDTAHKVLEASFNMLVSENKVQPQGYLVPDSKAPSFDKQCKALAQSRKARKQLFV